MNKYDKQRQKIFDTYSENLYHYFGTIALLDTTQIDRLRGNIYFCPLCYAPFPKEALIIDKNKNHLTLEHNPPKSLGGKSQILTCKNCNNSKGAASDHLVNHLLEMEAFVTGGNGSYDSRIEIEGKTIQAEFNKINQQIFIKPDKKSNPHTYQLLFHKLSNGEKIKTNTELTMPDWTTYSFAVLKMAYLKGFELFGYNFADLGNGRDMRACLAGEKAYPCFNNGVIDINADAHVVGISIVRKPEELQAIILTQTFSVKTKTGTVKKNIPVVLPAPIEGGWQRLENYNKYNDQQVHLTLEKIGIPVPPLNSNREFHRLFHETS